MERGSLLFHISSRTLDLRPVIGALAADAGLAVWMLHYRPPPGGLWRRLPAIVMALAVRGGDLSRFKPTDGGVEQLPPFSARSLWTDQRSDLFGAIRFRF